MSTPGHAGDSGGPLVCQEEDGQLKLAGIVSATHSNQPADYPAIFTRVSYFTEWIEAVMEKHPPKMSDNPLYTLHIKNCFTWRFCTHFCHRVEAPINTLTNACKKLTDIS
ncbi:hypothetical protein EG68_02550 [Paragonimus skrjabini miyazakii]|uniref:Peptidase S1 domain-containing protein n=1 Tax=Paragonimus skrjabini miyazakii TaxID=59628 RepID=A0A8S9YY50_9TREM|nr:hypothetical protein EG68_02550 [Paragonimus skrjabini miyazakii]